jgi:hypothetical protein
MPPSQEWDPPRSGGMQLPNNCKWEFLMIRKMFTASAVVAAATLASNAFGASAVSIDFNSGPTGALPGGVDGRAAGNGAWWVPDNAATSGVVTAGIGLGGTNGLVIGNRGNSNDGVIDNVHSPKLSEMTGESTVPAVQANRFLSSFSFRTVPTSVTSTAVYDFKAESWGRDRTTWLSFYNDNGLLKANYGGVDSNGTFTDNLGAFQPGKSFTWGDWYRVDTLIDFVDGDNNDVVVVNVFDSTNTLVWEAEDTTWEHYYRTDTEQAGNGNLITGVDALQFQARGNPAGNVAYVDNVVYLSQQVPEPASIGLLGIAGLAMLKRRRRMA